MMVDEVAGKPDVLLEVLGGRVGAEVVVLGQGGQVGRGCVVGCGAGEHVCSCCLLGVVDVVGGYE